MKEKIDKSSNSILHNLFAADAERRKHYLQKIEEKTDEEIKYLKRILYSIRDFSHLKSIELKLEALRANNVAVQKALFDEACKRYEQQHKQSGEAIIKEMWALLEKQFTRMLDSLKQQLQEISYILGRIASRILAIDTEIENLWKQHAEHIDKGIANIEKEILNRYQKLYTNGHTEFHFGEYLIDLLQSDFNDFRARKISQETLAIRVEEKEKSGFLMFLKEKNIVEPVQEKDALIQHKKVIDENESLRNIVEQNRDFSIGDRLLKAIDKLIEERIQLKLEERRYMQKKDMVVENEDNLKLSLADVTATPIPSSIEDVTTIHESINSNIPAFSDNFLNISTETEEKPPSEKKSNDSQDLFSGIAEDSDLLDQNEDLPSTPGIRRSSP